MEKEVRVVTRSVRETVAEDSDGGPGPAAAAAAGARLVLQVRVSQSFV